MFPLMNTFGNTNIIGEYESTQNIKNLYKKRANSRKIVIQKYIQIKEFSYQFQTKTEQMDLKFRQCFEFLLIISCGVFLHLNRISILDLKLSKLPGLVPSFSSTIFIFSILAILIAKMPSWPRQLKEPTWIIKLLIELFLILYVTDLVMRNFWVPILKVVGFLCKSSSSGLSKRIPFLSKWISKSGYYLLRFFISISTFVLMLEVVGAQNIYKEIMSVYENQRTVIPTPVPSEPTPQPIIFGRSRSNSRTRKRVSFQDSIYSNNPGTSHFMKSPVHDHEGNQCSICHKTILT